MSRDYDPVAKQWYQSVDKEALFQVLSVDPDEELVTLQYENGDIDEIDLDTWHEFDLEKVEEPDGWSATADATDVALEEDEEENDEDDDDEDDDDWDDDEEDDDDDWDDDDDDDYDDYDDRN